MTTAFDPGYGQEPFKGLCEDYPDETVYPAKDFRMEWGPIFHRGRLDGSARVLLIGQDPAQNETIVRRILVGEAGQRVQGFLAKLGIERSYVMINTFLYSVYGSVSSKHRKAPGILAYRHRWLDALVTPQVEVVIALGMLADEAWQKWRATPTGQNATAAYAAITQPDTVRPLVPYGEGWLPGDKVAIPDQDFPPGLPAWMRNQDNWARRVGADALAKRRTITVTVPKGIVSQT